MFDKIEPYPIELQKLSVFDGFLEQFYRYLRDSKTNVEAYDRTEELHNKYFSRNKYANYESFVALRARKLKKKK